MNEPTITAPWYDSPIGIYDSVVNGLEAFRALCMERHAAGYDRKERMREWVVASGHFWLDSCGNLWRVESPGKTDDFVLLKELAGHVIDGRTCTMAGLPKGVCMRCLRPWTLETAHDGHRIPRRDDDVGPEIRSEHHACRALSVIEDGRTDLLTIIERAGLTAVRPDNARLIPNGYSSSSSYPPWCIIDTPRGPIRMGWRKRVIHIDWDGAPDLASVRGAEVVAQPYITHGPTSVHCYGANAASDAIAKLWILADDRAIEAARVARNDDTP